ncbi:MAG: 30S ribosomal protein S8 [Chlamydiota bacterium]
MSAVSDPIADFFTRIRNAVRARHRYVDVKRSKLKMYIADVLKEHGYVDKVLTKDLNDNGHGLMRVFFRYDMVKEPVIKGIARVSTPGVRKYMGYNEIPLVYGGLGMAIVSTSQGVMSGKDARKKKIGGELIGKVW